MNGSLLENSLGRPCMPVDPLNENTDDSAPNKREILENVENNSIITVIIVFLPHKLRGLIP